MKIILLSIIAALSFLGQLHPKDTLVDEAGYDEVQPGYDEAQAARERYFREIAEKNKPGTVAADFLFELRTTPPGKDCKGCKSEKGCTDGPGREVRLHEFVEKSEKPVLMLFYDPDCGHCREVIEALKVSSIPDRCTILAIDAEDDRDLWDNTNTTLPADWHVAYALDPIQEDDTYVFLDSPTLYLVAPDKTVILKDTTLLEIGKALLLQSTPH